MTKMDLLSISDGRKQVPKQESEDAKKYPDNIAYQIAVTVKKETHDKNHEQ